MSDVTGVTTTLTNSVNVCLSVIGEAPVNSITGSSLPTQVALAKQTIEEVGRDVQSKGWWFNGAKQFGVTNHNTSGANGTYTRSSAIFYSRSSGSSSYFIAKNTANQAAPFANGNQVATNTWYLAVDVNSGQSTTLIDADLGTGDLPDPSKMEEGNLSISSPITLYSTDTSNDFATEIPEEARRYITIRAARVLQSRFVSSEELHKFSYNEELVSLATLQQANVRNGGNDTSFNAFPSELKDLGIEEVMFLQGSAEEKLLTLRLGTELKQQAKVAAETALLADQEALVTQQKQTEIQETTKRQKEHEILEKQKEKIDEEVDLLQSQDALVQQQKDQLEKQIALELTEEKAYSDAITGIASGTTYRDFAAELRMMGVQEPTFYQLPAYKKKEALKDATKLRTSTATETGSDATEISTVNNIRRMIGEAPITALNGDSMASEAVRMLRKTSTEMQGRGWWFNTEYDVEFTADGTGRITTTGMLTVELNDYDTRIKNVGGTKYLYDYKTKSHTTFSGTTKGKVIYERSLDDIPQKFQEYLEVRVAILLTEMYPRDGVDIQRLPRIERELEAYFKDRENDEGNYSIFDNYNTASRIGINRNYDIV